MAITDVEKAQLDELRRQLTQKTGVESFRKATENISLVGISLSDLKALVDPIVTQGFDFSSLDLATLDTDTLNETIPGAINVPELKKKISNQSLEKGSVIDLVDTQSGILRTQTKIKVNADIEDTMTSKVISQGTNLKMINLAKGINAESVANKQIKSQFIEEV
jgi:hypothetical protein